MIVVHLRIIQVKNFKIFNKNKIRYIVINLRFLPLVRFVEDSLMYYK